MESRAKLMGHSIHQMLIVFPLGLLATAIVFDAIYLVTHNPTMATVAYWLIVAGILGGLAAIPFGWIDWFAIPANTRAKRVGLVHAMTNGVVLVLFIASWWLRYPLPDQPSTLASVLSFAGAGGALVGAWLGGELVSRLGVGVDDGAHLNATNSLSGQPARMSEQPTASGPLRYPSQ